MFNIIPIITEVCPAGKASADVATAYNKAHASAECSNKGLCDRSTGLCKCFLPFTGGACERSELRHIPVCNCLSLLLFLVD